MPDRLSHPDTSIPITQQHQQLIILQPHLNVREFRLACEPFPAAPTILTSFANLYAPLATFNAIHKTEKSALMAEAPCTVASTPCPNEHTTEGQAVWTKVATRRFGPLETVALGHEQKNQVVDDTAPIACSSALTRAGHIVMDVETPCTNGVCPYCGSSTCKGNCGSTGGGFVCLLS